MMDTVYKWFAYLKSKNHFLEGYVVGISAIADLITAASLQGKRGNLILINDLVAEAISR